MGRLVGIGGALVVVAVVGLFLGFGAFFVEESGGSSRQDGADLSSEKTLVAVDPACLWPLLDASFSPDAPQAPNHVSLQDCSPADAEIVVDEDWNRVSLHRGAPEDPNFERRFSGARVAYLSDEGWIAVEAYDSWGGSGVFSSLVTGRLAAEGAELRDIKVQAFGDRCNGGLAGTHTTPDGRLIARANMTPWDIMVAPFSDLPFEAQWARAKEQYGGAVGNAPSCAVCCTAVTMAHEVDPEGTITPLGLRYEAAPDLPSADALTVCLEKAVQSAAGDDGYVDGGESAALAVQIGICAKEMSD